MGICSDSLIGAEICARPSAIEAVWLPRMTVELSALLIASYVTVTVPLLMPLPRLAITTWPVPDCETNAVLPNGFVADRIVRSTYCDERMTVPAPSWLLPVLA